MAANRRWTDEEQAILREMWEHHSLDEIAMALGRTMAGVERYGQGLKLRRRDSPEIRERVARVQQPGRIVPVVSARTVPPGCVELRTGPRRCSRCRNLCTALRPDGTCYHCWNMEQYKER